MIRSGKTLAWFGLAAAGIAIGMQSCGGGGGSSTLISEGDFCQQKAEKECAVSSRCATVKTDCEAARKAVCLNVVGAAKTESKPTGVMPRVFHPENINNCLSKTNTVYTKNGAITPAELGDMNDACAYVIQGSAMSMAACGNKYDCTSKTQICDKGFCSDKVTKSLSQPCGNPGEVCSTGSYCAQNPTNPALYTCVAKIAQSMPCSATLPCVENLRCDATSNTCQPRAAASEACVTDDDCATAVPYCDPYVGNKCDQGLTFGGGAAACRDFGGSSSGGLGGSTGNNDAATGG